MTLHLSLKLQNIFHETKSKQLTSTVLQPIAVFQLYIWWRQVYNIHTIYRYYIGKYSWAYRWKFRMLTWAIFTRLVIDELKQICGFYSYSYNYITSVFHWNVTIWLVMKWSHDYIKEMFYIPIKLKPELARASMTTSDVNNQWRSHF